MSSKHRECGVGGACHNAPIEAVDHVHDTACRGDVGVVDAKGEAPGAVEICRGAPWAMKAGLEQRTRRTLNSLSPGWMIEWVRGERKAWSGWLADWLAG